MFDKDRLLLMFDENVFMNKFYNFNDKNYSILLE